MWLDLEVVNGVCQRMQRLFQSVKVRCKTLPVACADFAFSTQLAYCTMPTYGGEICFIISSKHRDAKLNQPKRKGALAAGCRLCAAFTSVCAVRKALGKKNAKVNALVCLLQRADIPKTLRYYTSDIHQTSFVLPRFVLRALQVDNK